MGLWVIIKELVSGEVAMLLLNCPCVVSCLSMYACFDC